MNRINSKFFYFNKLIKIVVFGAALLSIALVCYCIVPAGLHNSTDGLLGDIILYS